MIVKSMPRKDPSFGQLFDYMMNGSKPADHKFKTYHNFYSRKRDGIEKEFLENSSLLKHRKNGNYLYHEIISIKPSKKISMDRQKEILADIVKIYVDSRAKNHLVCGYLHDEHDNNLHYHLMISSNEVGLSERHRLSKENFSEIKKGLEKWVLEKYPELEQEKLISKENTYRDKKRNLTDTLKEIFSKARTREEFHNLLQDQNLSYKVRGETVSFVDENGKAHRVKTLGIFDEYQKMTNDFDSIPKKKEEPKKETVKDFAKEIVSELVTGDFSNREKRIEKQLHEDRKKVWKEQHDKDSQVKDKALQTKEENIKESLSEWVMGDFSKREARQRNEEAKNKLKAWREKQNTVTHEKTNSNSKKK